MKNLKGKTAIITGGGTGVGRAIATTLVEEGVNVLLASRTKDHLIDTANQLNKIGKGKAITASLDVRDKENCIKVAQLAVKEFGSIDFLVNNAGLGVGSLVKDTTEADWDKVIDTNLKGTFFMMQSVLPTMIDQESGFILNIASQAAKRGYAQAGPYCASKFGVVGLGDALQEEVYEHGITVHSLCPALIQTPAPTSEEDRDYNVLQVEDLAETVAYLFKMPERVKIDDIGLYARPKSRTRV
ncbi:SDR family NAD(P)-dependent oxidoreductase [Flammeovirga yaeyamensis]|uniref:SDR family NAD(P)-dependent oxidoreductase n=1 Tax=Flammeovirga yaeyamensis TaxID=367791 RepID=A0AAX1N8L8_9BACT|nr:SDR family oxidoreductase [Flammeovirga yaeyamensis]MBB3698728.1 NADP-dependent 3-hydroxy acid dehydrogenase YdfG [Flammeovirga yaeyamensis]NMF37314.1 SDR family oxidoreductase [Flammeovirga yaeyamensis]QWG03868.1 SDR family NAD(P)-dependent oxidoreductase [Flammeovirga yaeyamensis]